jgi:hypothetical protein
MIMKVSYLTAEGKREYVLAEEIEVLDAYGKPYVIRQDCEGGLMVDSGIHGYGMETHKNADSSITVTTLTMC